MIWAFIKFSSLSESGFIPTWNINNKCQGASLAFSSLSESGFIPTLWFGRSNSCICKTVLISFREWLHSYMSWVQVFRPTKPGSHLFQRVASFLPGLYVQRLRERRSQLFSSLSESGFIPTRIADCIDEEGVVEVLISFREWLHSYNLNYAAKRIADCIGSHLFQRVASFLRFIYGRNSNQFG